MAGSLNETHLKNIPQCHHGSLCVLKTGTSKNANHGKSFFICNNTDGRCSYAIAAKGFEATVCPKHEKMVELKAFAKKENGIRCYFRCVFGKEKGETWCGHELVAPTRQPQKKNVLKDITNHVNPTDKSKEPLKSKMATTKTSSDILPISKINDSKINDNMNSQDDCTIVEKSEKKQDNDKMSSANSNTNIVSLPPTDISESITSLVDMTKSSFNVPRNTRISDISEASSTDVSNISSESHDVSKNYIDTRASVDDGIIDSSMLSNNEEDLHDNDESNESSIDVTQSSADDFESPQVHNVQKDAPVSSMLSCNDVDSNKKTSLVPDSDSDESDHDEVYHVPRDAAVDDIIDSSMLSNIEDEIDEIADVLNSTSLHTAPNDDGDRINESRVFEIPKNAVVEQPAKNDTLNKSNKNSNIIEIIDSSDDETDVSVTDVRSRNVLSNNDRPTDVRPRMSSTNDSHPSHAKHVQPINVDQVGNHQNNIMSYLPPMTTHVPPITPAICWSKIQSLKLQIRRQQEIYAKMAKIMPDGGKRLIDNITALSKELDVVQKDYSELQKAAANTHGTLPINVHYPSISNGSLQYTDAHNNIHEVGGYPGQYRPAPLFGGRMTEKRLKEVGTITKNTIEQLHQSLDSRPAPTEEAEDPQLLKVTLMRHQKQALSWLLWREKQTPPGGILADDMGLGKTLTMISLALKSKQDDLSQIKELPKDSKLILSKGSVIICPASLIHQWQKEVEKRVKDPTFTVYLYHGANREKKVKKLAMYDIVLTTYNIASIEGKKFSIDEKAKPQEHLSDWHESKKEEKVPEVGPLFKIFWRRIILDEGHTIKNHKTGGSIAICAMEGESRWIVTGTPIQNNTMELYSLIKFLRVTPFDEFKVWRREVDNKMVSGTKRMNSIVASLLLRRTKDQIDAKTGKPLIILPKRSATLHKLKLSSGELQVYELVQHYSKKMFKRFLDTRKEVADGEPMNPSIPQEKESYEMPKSVLGVRAEVALSMLGLRGPDVVNQSCLLVLVLRLRQCCTHLSLMCEQIDPELCKSEGIETPLEDQLQNLSIDENNDVDVGDPSSRPKEMLPTFLSSKISTLLSCLNDLRKESTGKPVKSVIVSQWTRMLEIVAYHLKVAGYKYDFITGGVNVKKRSDLVDSFNNEKYPEIMLVSLKAGGVGLNLIGGSHLFILDQHWNPALEDQASDRIYRVGQKNDVTVHRFLCTDTVEERIAALQEKKKALANSVLYGGKMAQKLTLADLKMIFGLGT